MNQTQLQKFINALTSKKQKQIVINIQSQRFRKGLSRSPALIAKIERNMRIQKLELAVKKLNLTRCWV